MLVYKLFSLIKKKGLLKKKPVRKKLGNRLGDLRLGMKVHSSLVISGFLRSVSEYCPVRGGSKVEILIRENGAGRPRS